MDYEPPIKRFRRIGRRVAVPFLAMPCIAALLLAGCSLSPAAIRNAPLARYVPEAASGRIAERYDFGTWLAAHRGRIPKTALILSFSGGGGHAAALARAVLDELDGHEFVTNPVGGGNGGRRLTDNVLMISATSGGTMTATAFTLGGMAALRAPRFDNGIVRYDIAGMLKTGLIWPPFAADRSKRFERFIARGITDDLTIGELYGTENARGGLAPFLVLNTTDIASGAPFPLTQDYFGDLCSDVSRLPLKTAVTAASGFLRRRAKAITTGTVLGEPEILAMNDSGRTLLLADPCFQQFLLDSAATSDVKLNRAGDPGIAKDCVTIRARAAGSAPPYVPIPQLIKGRGRPSPGIKP